jgi:hypothetical protein
MGVGMADRDAKHVHPPNTLTPHTLQHIFFELYRCCVSILQTYASMDDWKQ